MLSPYESERNTTCNYFNIYILVVVDNIYIYENYTHNMHKKRFKLLQLQPCLRH